MKGFGFRTEAGSVLDVHGKSRRMKDCWEAGDEALSGGSVLVLAGVGRRWRGWGGGSSGRTSNNAVNSYNDGIGVVRAFTTTRAKSGGPGAVFRKGVDGLYKLKNILYGDDVSTCVVVPCCNGTACPEGRNLRD